MHSQRERVVVALSPSRSSGLVVCAMISSSAFVLLLLHSAIIQFITLTTNTINRFIFGSLT